MTNQYYNTIDVKFGAENNLTNLKHAKQHQQPRKELIQFIG